MWDGKEGSAVDKANIAECERRMYGGKIAQQKRARLCRGAEDLPLVAAQQRAIAHPQQLYHHSRLLLNAPGTAIDSKNNGQHHEVQRREDPLRRADGGGGAPCVTHYVA